MLLQHRLAFGVLLCVAGAAPSVHAQTGGCCLGGGVCISVTEAGCAAAFPPGAYQGDGSTCPGLCGQQGACCFTDGSCQVLFYGPCNTGDGTFQGNATVCLPNPCPPPAPVPTQINHQGVVTVLGQRFTGDGSFYFAIIDPATGNSGWTNDATNIGTTNRPNQAVPIVCANGLYDVRLGDLTSYDNMKPIPVDVFSLPNRVLRIWFNDGVNGVFQMTPDHALTSVPYAIRAAETDSGIPQTIVFTSSGTWTKPSGLKYIEVEVVGGGGGGGSSSDLPSGGGAGGGYSKRTIVAPSLGTNETVTVGLGGAAGTGLSNGIGTPGGTSSFGGHLSATGGSGGPAIGMGANGGVGSGGEINVNGQTGGGTLCVVIQSNTGCSSSGMGGSSVLGFGAAGQINPGGDGAAGHAYGGGGSGSYPAGPGRTGGPGAAGVVIVKEFF